MLVHSSLLSSVMYFGGFPMVCKCKCQYSRLGDHALSERRCWAPSDDGVGQSSVEESGLGL